MGQNKFIISIFTVTLVIVLGTTLLSITYAQGENNAPTISSLTIATSSQGSDISTLTLIEATATNIYIRGTATDVDGCGQIDAVADYTMVVYRSGVGGAEACSSDNRNCYQTTESDSNLAGTCTGGEDNTVNFEFAESIWFYAQPTDTGTYSAENWLGYIKVEDEHVDIANAVATDNFELASSNSLNVTSSVEYGTLNFSSDSAQQVITVTNTGNTTIDYTVAANAAFNCEYGVIPAANVHYSLSNGFAYDLGTAMSQSPGSLDVNLAPQTSGSSGTTTVLYTVLRTPSTGAGGGCNSILIFTATGS